MTTLQKKQIQTTDTEQMYKDYLDKLRSVDANIPIDLIMKVVDFLMSTRGGIYNYDEVINYLAQMSVDINQNVVAWDNVTGCLKHFIINSVWLAKKNPSRWSPKSTHVSVRFNLRSYAKMIPADVLDTIAYINDGVQRICGKEVKDRLTWLASSIERYPDPFLIVGVAPFDEESVRIVEMWDEPGF